jgi:hypothetical protein
MPATLVQPSAQLVGPNSFEFLNQAQMQLRPHLKIAFSYATLNNAVLFTVPTLVNGAAGLGVENFFWEVTTGFTGGSSSAIAATTSRAPWTTVGAVIGGTGGDVAATLVSTNKYVPGTVGPAFSTGAVTTGKVILRAGDTITFQRVTSAFTVGEGYLHFDGYYVD